MAADPAPAAVLRRVSPGCDRPRAVRGVQGAQAEGGGRAACGARGRCGPARSTRAAAAERVGRLLAEAGGTASEELEARGLPPLPTTTPHTLQRTYISIALLANGFDVKWAMSQVGHADSKMTLDVYAQLEQRADRTHGTSFDALLRRAEEARTGADSVMIGSRRRFEGDLEPETAPRRRTRKTQEQGNLGHGETRTRTGDTTIFSRVLYQLSYLAERARKASASPTTP